LGEAATGVMRENVKRKILTHHALRITQLASRANLAGKHVHAHGRAAAHVLFVTTKVAPPLFATKTRRKRRHDVFFFIFPFVSSKNFEPSWLLAA